MITVNGFNLSYAEHMLHRDNLESVLRNGLLSHNAAYAKGLIVHDISMPEVQEIRKKKSANAYGSSYNLHDLVSFYFNSRNPMMYKRKNVQQELFVILIDIDIIKNKNTDPVFAIFSDGNAGSKETDFFTGENNLASVDFNMVFADSWNIGDEEIKKREQKKTMCRSISSPQGSG